MQVDDLERMQHITNHRCVISCFMVLPLVLQAAAADKSDAALAAAAKSAVDTLLHLKKQLAEAEEA